MVERLVYDCSQILRVLSAGDTNVNTIVKKSGLYKNYVYKGIKALEKGKLVKAFKIPNHDQMKMKSLTELGKEIADMAVGIDFYKKSHEEMLKVIGKHIENREDINSKAMKSILRSRGWNADEIPLYPQCAEGVDYIMQHSGMILKEGLINWYMDILSDFSPLSDIAKSIINNLVVEAISYQISVLLGSIEENHSDSNIGVMDYANLYSFLKSFSYYFPNMMFNEVKKEILSDLLILRPSKEDIDELIQHSKLCIEQIRPEIAQKQGLSQPKYRHKCLLAAYDEYAKMKLN